MAFMAAAAPWISATGTALGVIQQVQAANYQAAVAKAGAETAEENARRETLAANRDMMARDQEAGAAIAELQAGMDASGIRSGNGTMLLRRRGVEELAARDRENLAEKRDTNIRNRQREAAGLLAEASAYKSGAFLSALGGLASIPGSYLSTATTVNDYTRSLLRSSKPSISGV